MQACILEHCSSHMPPWHANIANFTWQIVGGLIQTTITLSALAAVAIPFVAIKFYPKETEEFVNALLKKAGTIGTVLEKHNTYTLPDLLQVSGRDSNISYFGVAITSLARSIKHVVLGIFSVFSFNVDNISIYFHRSYIDISGCGIGLVGTIDPKTADRMQSDFHRFLIENAVKI